MLDFQFHPQDWYWLKEDTVYSTRQNGEVPLSNAEYQQWLARGNLPTGYPKAADNVSWSREELARVLAPYGLRVYPLTLEEQLADIDAKTSEAILAGFDYELDAGDGPEMLHFSYDAFDQQNFADAANAAILAQLSGQTGPSVTWNAYRNYTPETGGELVRLSLDAAGFLALYTGGAIAHKGAKMEEGGQSKATLQGEGVA